MLNTFIFVLTEWRSSAKLVFYFKGVLSPSGGQTIFDMTRSYEGKPDLWFLQATNSTIIVMAQRSDGNHPTGLRLTELSRIVSPSLASLSLLQYLVSGPELDVNIARKLICLVSYTGLSLPLLWWWLWWRNFHGSLWSDHCLGCPSFYNQIHPFMIILDPLLVDTCSKDGSAVTKNM